MTDGRRGVLKAARASLLAIVIASSLAGCAGLSAPPATVERGDYRVAIEQLTARVQREMRQQDITGLSIALIDGQRVVWSQGFGFADRSTGEPATADTLYRVGSISKLFTAAAAMQLAEQGRLAIDRPLAEALPGFAMQGRLAGAPAITPRQLMTHHAGLPSDRVQGMWSQRPQPFTALPALLRDEVVATAPNTVLSYSNLGVSLLGAAIEQASGRPFAEHLQQSLLGPLGMSRSSFTDQASVPGQARAYVHGAEAPEYGLRDVPAGGLHSTVNDLARLVQMMLADGLVVARSNSLSNDPAQARPAGPTTGGRLLAAASVDEMLRPQNANVPLDFDQRIGLAWFLDHNARWPGAGPIASHNGATHHFRAHLSMLKSHGLGVVVLSNSANAMDAVNRIGFEALRLAFEVKTGQRALADAAQPAGPPPRPVALTDETAQQAVGRYATAMGLVTVRRQGPRLQASIAGQSLELVPHDDGLLRPRYAVLGLVPIDLGALGRTGLGVERVAGREVVVAHRSGRRWLMGEKVSPPPLPAGLARYLGDYEPVNVGPDDAPDVRRITVGVDDGIGVAEVAMGLSQGRLRLALAPADADGAATHRCPQVDGVRARPAACAQLILLGLGRNLGETVHLGLVDGVEHAYFGGLALRRVGAAR